MLLTYTWVMIRFLNCGGLSRMAPSRKKSCFPYPKQCSDLSASHVLHTRAVNLVPESRMCQKPWRNQTRWYWLSHLWRVLNLFLEWWKLVGYDGSVVFWSHVVCWSRFPLLVNVFHDVDMDDAMEVNEFSALCLYHFLTTWAEYRLIRC